MTVQCAILAGGLATRMRPASSATPKWLLSVAGRPFAEWQLEWLASQGVTRVLVCTGHLAGAVGDAIGDGHAFGLSVAYSDDGPRPLGTGGAIRRAGDAGLLEDRFAVLYGDSYLAVDVPAVWRTAAASTGPALMTVFHNEDRLDRSNVAFEDGAVTRYAKGVGAASGAPLRYIDYGLSVLHRSVVDEIPSGASDLGDLYAALAADGRLAGYEAHERFYEVGSPDGLRQLSAHLADGAGR